MMIRQHFHNILHELEKELIDMGSLVIEAIRRSIKALKTLDVEEAQRIIDDDKKINDFRSRIEEVSIQLIATQQPVASDLRELITFFDIIINLERMADHAKGIANIVQMHGQMPLIKPLVDIPIMAEKTVEMIQNSLTAFIDRDAALAKKTIAKDDEIDILNDRVYQELLSMMIKNPQIVNQATYLLWVSHNLERIADRVTNICERIQFLINGTTYE